MKYSGNVSSFAEDGPCVKTPTTGKRVIPGQADAGNYAALRRRDDLRQNIGAVAIP
jgi:hypothetical protein